MGATWQPSVKDLSRADGDLETRLYLSSSLVSSIAQVVLSAIAASFFIGWWAWLWLAAMVGLFALRANAGENRIPEGAAGTFFIALGGVVFAAPAAGAWMVGGVSAAFILATMVATTAIVGNTLFASSSRNFWANLGPPLAMATFAPLITQSNFETSLIVVLCVAQTALAAMSARNNRNQLLEQVLRIQSEMEAARKESLAKSQFLATMSHELRTPLNAVIGYAEILEEELSEDGRTANASDAARIRRSARSLLTLINEILDFSKIEAGRMEMSIGETDVAQTIADAVQTVAHMTNAHVTVVNVDIDAGAKAVWTDSQRLRQCVLNLLSNAAKFTEGGRIDARACIENEAGESFLRIDVSDTGCGISEADGARLFQPFSQADGSLTRKKDGTGLGLVITKRLCELLGGDVSFVSTEGKGSTFTLRVRDHASALAAASGDGPAVLVIEDEFSARDLLRRMLAHLPLAMVEARTAAEGLSAARTRAPQLIVLDIHLPDRSGWELLAEIKADDDLRDTPVLVVSADSDRTRALSLGACEHLVKPVDKEQIAAAVLRFARSDAMAAPLATNAAESAAA